MVKRPEHEGDYSPVSSVGDRNERFYVVFLLYVLFGLGRDNFTFLLL